MAKLLFCYFWCKWSTINLSLGQVGLDREFDQLSKNVWFTEFGWVNNFELNFEFNPLNRVQIKRKSLIWTVGLRRERNWAGPTGSLCCGLNRNRLNGKKKAKFKINGPRGKIQWAGPARRLHASGWFKPKKKRGRRGMIWCVEPRVGDQMAHRASSSSSEP